MASDSTDVASKSLPVWGAWIEIALTGIVQKGNMSLPVWGAWIEIPNNNA